MRDWGFNVDVAPAIVLTQQQHDDISRPLLEALPTSPLPYTRGEVWEKYQEVYSNNPEYLDAIRDTSSNLEVRMLYVLSVAKQVNVLGGPSDDGRYSMDSACPQCGSGALRIEPLKLDQKRLPRESIFMTLDREYIVAQELAERIRNAGLGCLRTIVDLGSGMPLGYEELVPQDVFPPFSCKTTGYLRLTFWR